MGSWDYWFAGARVRGITCPRCSVILASYSSPKLGDRGCGVRGAMRLSVLGTSRSSNRWCRSAQPPANCYQASGLTDGATLRGGPSCSTGDTMLHWMAAGTPSSQEPGGFSAISRWLSAATPPVSWFHGSMVPWGHGFMVSRDHVFTGSRPAIPARGRVNLGNDRRMTRPPFSTVRLIPRETSALGDAQPDWRCIASLETSPLDSL
jgi:hypothetical protein